MHNEDIIICRCEDLTLAKLHELIKQGYTSVDEIKRISRAGMGPCQGRTCRALIEREIALLTKQAIVDQPPTTFRQPTKPVTFAAILEGDKHE